MKGDFKMNNEMLWKTSCQEGVTFYSLPDNPRCAVDLDIDDNVTELKFINHENRNSGFNVMRYRLTNCDKVFPQVETIFIDKNVTIIEILNKIFPNVKTVISESKTFCSGNVLIRNDADQSGGYELLNTFCKKSGEEINLKRVKTIRKNAFDGCNSANIINTDEIRICNTGAFSGYNAIDRLPMVDGARMIGPAMVSFSSVIPKVTKAISSGIDFTGKSVSVSDIRVIQYIHSEKMPESVYIDDVGAIPPIHIYGALRFGVKYVNINPDNPYYKSVDGVIYSSDGTYLMKCPAGMTGIFRIPDGVKTIGARAFMGAHLNTVIFSDSVTDIEEYAFSHSYIEHVVFGKTTSYIGENMFTNCLKLKDIKIPSQIKKICDSAFYPISSKLTEVEFSDGIEEICSNAFRFSPGAEKCITLPSSIKKLGKLGLANVGHINVTTRKGMLPEGLFGAINASSSESKDRVITYLTIDGHEYILPFYNAHAAEMDLYFKFLPFDPKRIWNIYQFISDNKKRISFMLFTYSTIDDEEIKNNIKEELKNMQNATVKWLYKANRCNLLKFLSLGVASESTLKKLIQMCDANNDITMKAYVLDAMKWLAEIKKEAYKL